MPEMPVLVEDDCDDEQLPVTPAVGHVRPAKMTRQDTVNSTTDIKQYGKNGDVFNAGRRTTDNLNKAIKVALTDSITALVHANSRAQVDAIEKKVFNPRNN